MKKVLFSVLLICLVAAMVGAGTWAYFSDYEHSNDNYFSGGTLDLKVDGEDDPDVITYFEVECVAPGDEGVVNIALCNEGCVDGEADLHLTMTVNDDNGIAEPESDVDVTDGPGNGELCQNLMMRISVDLDDNGSYETVIIEGAFTDIECINWILGDLNAYSCIGLQIEWWVPTSVGNEIMTDLCGFDVEFSLNQKQLAYNYYDLTVTSDGCCPITVVGQGAVAPGATETFAGIREGTTVVVEADDSDPCCEFVSWSDGGTQTHGVLMDGNKTVVAVCVEPTYDLTVVSQGCCPITVGTLGTVAAGQSQTWTDLACNTVVSLDADDSSPSCTFVEWLGDVDNASNVDPNQVTMVGGDKTVTAVCQGVGWNLTLTSAGCCDIQWSYDTTSGTVGAGQTETVLDIPGGTDVTVTADDSDPCCAFVGWDDGGAQSHVIHMDANKSATATCEIIERDLTVISDGCCDIQVSYDGSGGTQTVAAGGSRTFTDIPCCTSVNLNAVPTDALCCQFTGWSGNVADQGAAQTTVHINQSDETVTAHCVWLDSDLTVNSIGCCDVQVDWTDPGGAHSVTIPAGGTDYFLDMLCCTQVTVTAIPVGALCVCDDIVVDGVSVGCSSTTVHMDGTDHVVDVYCHEIEIPVPDPCCWVIYDVDWWKLPNAPPNPTTEDDIYALHTLEWYPEGHTEVVGSFTIVIPDPSWVQVTSFYDPAWVPNIPGRDNPLLGAISVTRADFYNSSLSMLNWKTIYGVNTVLGPLTVYVWTLGIVPVSGAAGWPFAVGNSWLSVGVSTISTPSTSYFVATAAENIVVPLFPGGIDCIKVEGFGWTDVDGVDNDGDGATDEDWLNFYDDDGDGLTDEDGGDGIPQAGELTPSSVKWWNNAYGSPIREWNLPGALFNGYEYRDMSWYCFDPPFPPWQ